ncbi:MAG: ion transporter, partial [Bacteroidetes bacterium]
MDDQVKASHFSHQNRLQKARRHLHRLLSPSAEKGNASWWLDIFLMSLISLNILAVILETVKPLALQHRIFFYWFEFVSVLIFSVEYLLRLWAANEEPAYRTPVLGNLRYALTPLALVDLLAILPFYLPLVGLDLRFLRILRLLRLFTLFKLARYSAALTLFAKVFREKREELLISITFTLFLLLVSSSLMYYVENQAQPEVFSSIPETMWWGIAT